MRLWHDLGLGWRFRGGLSNNSQLGRVPAGSRMRSGDDERMDGCVGGTVVML